MRFTPNQTLLDGPNRYEEGQEYDVPEDRVKYLVSLGWGSAPDLSPQPAGEPPQQGTVTLRPDDVSSGTGSDVS